jgi:hypothetical protein
VGNFSNVSGRQIASESGPNPGVLAYDLTDDATGPFACTDNTAAAADLTHISEAYMYGSGLQSATNNYNVSPGQPDSAWKVAATQIPGECTAPLSAIAGGPSGFGLLEAPDSSDGLRHRPFDASTAAFDEPSVSRSRCFTAATVARPGGAPARSNRQSVRASTARRSPSAPTARAGW